MFSGRKDLHRFVSETYASDVPITYLEFGVYEGGSMRVWCELNKNPQSRFVGFDSFEGLPEDWLPTHPEGTFSLGGKPPEIEDSRVSFQVGWFQKTLPGFMTSYEWRDDYPLIVHCDCDLYSSTLFCLASLNGIVRAGTVIMFDDFPVVLDEFRALTSYAQVFMRTYKLIGATPGFRQIAIEIL